MSSSSEQKSGAAPHVTWDEETIALHDAERGTRMKIEEPKTPYHYYGSDGDDHNSTNLGVVSPARSLSGKEDAPPIEWKELQVKLQHVQDQDQKQQQQQQQPPPSAERTSEWDISDDESASTKGDAKAVAASSHRFAARDAEGKKIEKDPQFTDKRKSHYNEYQQMQMWRQSHPSDDDEDDEDDEDQKKA